MNKLVALTLLLIAFSLGYSQNRYQIKWQKQFGGSSGEENSLLLKINNGFLIGGTSASNISGNKSQNSRNSTRDYWIVRVDSLGNKIWDKTFGGNNIDYLDDVKLLSDGNILLAGSSFQGSGATGDRTEPDRGRYDIWLVKIDTNGNKIWDKTYGGNMDEYNAHILPLKNGVLIGSSSSSSASMYKSSNTRGGNGNSDYWIFKIDNNGNKIWDSIYGGNGGEDLGKMFRFKNDYFIIGYSTSDSNYDRTSPNSDQIVPDYDFWVLKIDSNGKKIWDKSYSTLTKGASNQITNSIMLSNSNIVISEIWNGVLCIDTNGKKVWEKVYSEGIESYGLAEFNNQICFLSSSTSHKVGLKSENAIGSSDFWLLATDFKGNKLWDKTIGGSDFERAGQIVASNDRLLISGISTSNISGHKILNSFGSSDFWLIELAKITNKITGRIFTDYNNDCVFDSLKEHVIQNRLVYNSNEDNYVLSSNKGYIHYNFNSSNATLSIKNLYKDLKIMCAKDSIILNCNNFIDTSGVDFPIQTNKRGSCLNVISFVSNIFRRDRWSNSYVQIANEAFDTAFNTQLKIEVDTAQIDSISSNLSFSLAGNVLTFSLGNFKPYEFKNIQYSFKLKQGSLLGSSICQRAVILPLCSLKDNPNFDSSKISLKINCLNKTAIQVKLENNSIHSQKSSSDLYVYKNDTLQYLDNFKLNSNSSKTFQYAIDSSFIYTFKAILNNNDIIQPVIIKHDDHCGIYTFFIANNPVLNFPRYDEALEYEENCDIIRGSYDPNIKHVQPKGTLEDHFVPMNTKLTYRVDFQNTGNDTAFNVIIKDSIDSNLDLKSILPGVSSHSYTIEIRNRVISFIFNNINLPDSNINEKESHGFVYFQISPLSQLSQGKIVKNSASIYFDNNDPIITNRVWNTYRDVIVIAAPKQSSNISSNSKIEIDFYPNPISSIFTLSFTEPLKNLNIEILNSLGQTIKREKLSQTMNNEIDLGKISNGIYILKIFSDEKLITIKKLQIKN